MQESTAMPDDGNTQETSARRKAAVNNPTRPCQTLTPAAQLRNVAE